MAYVQQFHFLKEHLQTLAKCYVELGVRSTSVKVVLKPKVLKEFANAALKQLISSYVCVTVGNSHTGL